VADDPAVVLSDERDGYGTGREERFDEIRFGGSTEGRLVSALDGQCVSIFRTTDERSLFQAANYRPFCR
jgi:hypothetical protein